MNKPRLDTNRPDSPHGGWRYEDPKTGKLIKALSYKALYRAISIDRMKRGVEQGDIYSNIADYLCAVLPPGAKHCSYEPEDNIHGPRKKYTVSDVKSFLGAVAGSIKNGVVSQEEADRRAAICARCPHNKRLAGCYGCNNIAGKIFEVIGSRKTTSDHFIHQCGVCGCDLKAKVWVRPEHVRSAPNVQENWDLFPDHCWQKDT